VSLCDSRACPTFTNIMQDIVCQCFNAVVGMALSVLLGANVSVA